MKDLIRKRWAVGTCHLGEKCWCRIIDTEDPNDEDYVIGAAALNKEVAEYIVKLHNAYLDEYICEGEVLEI